MAGSLTNAGEALVLEHLVGKNTWAAVTPFIALFTVAPSDTGGGTECTGGSYARQSTAATDWNTAGTDGQIENAAIITFVTPTGSWGTANSFAIMTAVTAGTMLAWADLTTPQAIGTGNTVSFAAGALVITLD